MFCCAWLSHTVVAATIGIPAVWPVNAIVLAGLLRSPSRAWPSIFLGGFIGMLAGDLTSGDALQMGVMLSVCNVFEISICAFGLRWLAGSRPDLSRQKDFWIFAPLCFAAAIMSGVLALSAGGAIVTPTAGKMLAIWLLADGLGLLIVTPALLCLSWDKIGLTLAPARRSRALLATTALIAVVWGVFALSPAPMLFVVSAALIAFVFEFETVGAATGTLITAAVCIGLTLVRLRSSGLSHDEGVEQVLRLQLYLAVSAVLNMSVAAALVHRRELQEALTRSEAVLKVKRAEAEAAARAKSDFLANMTHELRTPLTAIVGFAWLLKESDAVNDRDRRRIEAISDASQSLLGVVNDVLDVSKYDQGHVEFEIQPFDPRALGESVVTLLDGQAQAKGLKLSATLVGDGGYLLGDATRLRQILLNFVANAIKFTAHGGVTIRVQQTGTGRLRQLRVAVEDDGIGVPPDMIETIFDRFTQGDTSVTRKYGGTGLGLAICKRIVDAMHGTIGVERRPGGGSSFWFEVALPVSEPERAEAVSPVAPVGPERPLRVLVAEDNAVNRELVCALLEPFGLEIVTAVDGVEAVEAVSLSTFDLVLMDVQMPNLDGLTATRRIRAAEASGGRRLPVIAMTANVLPEQISRCLEAGMDDHVGKPINLQQLLNAIDRWSSDEAAADSPLDVHETAA